MALTLQDIEQLFLERGHRSYDGESVSHLRHALQTAALAERHHAGPELITACLLHDLGHLIADRPGTPSCAAWTTSTSTSCCLPARPVRPGRAGADPAARRGQALPLLSGAPL